MADKTYAVKEVEEAQIEAKTVFTITEAQAPVVREVTLERLEQEKAQIQAQIDSDAERMAVIDSDIVEVNKIKPVAEVIK